MTSMSQFRSQMNQLQSKLRSAQRQLESDARRLKQQAERAQRELQAAARVFERESRNPLIRISCPCGHESERRYSANDLPDECPECGAPILYSAM